MHQFVIKLKKLIFAHFLSKNSIWDFSKKKLLLYCNFKKVSWVLIFDKTQKTSLWAHFEPLLVQIKYLSQFLVIVCNAKAT